MSASDTFQNNASGQAEGTGDGSGLADTARTDLAGLGEEVSQQAAALGQEAQAQIGELADKAKGLADEQKELLASQVGGVSEALNRVAEELSGNSEASARYVRMMADGAQRLTSTLNDNSVDDILAIAQDFGRKQPAAFLGLAALLGFAASRFVSASASRSPRSTIAADTPSVEPSPYASVSGGTGGSDVRI